MGWFSYSLLGLRRRSVPPLVAAIALFGRTSFLPKREVDRLQQYNVARGSWKRVIHTQASSESTPKMHRPFSQAEV